MKKILFALAMLPILAFVGCSSDDDNSTKVDFDHNIEWLYGEWRATSVEAGPLSIDLTDPTFEVMVLPTYVIFKKGGMYESEGVLGNGTGKYITKGKTITTSLNDEKISFDVTSLTAKSAKIEINAKALGLPMIPEEIGTVVVVLTKDYPREIDFDYDVELLYGEWRATAVEGVDDEPIDLTNALIEMVVAPTYVTFGEKGVYSSKGILGEGTGRYATKDKLIVTAIDNNVVSFEMKELSAETAKIEINAEALGLPIIPEGIEEVIVVLTKQKGE